MKAAGLDVWYPAELLAERRYAEGLRRLPELIRVRRELIARLLDDPPDLFVGVAEPHFNLRLEESLRRGGVRTVQFGAPQGSVGKGPGLHRLRRAVDRALVLFPFEVPLLEAAGIPVSFVGHPLADLLPELPDRQAARDQFRLSGSQTVVALLPGNRVSELESMADLFIEVAKLIHRQVRNAHFLVPLQSRQARAVFEQALYRLEAQDLPLTILFGHAHLAMTAADSVLLTSATASLEAALLKRPMIMTCRLPRERSGVSEQRSDALPFIALPNVLAGRFVVPEIAQEEATADVLAQAVLNQLYDKVTRRRQEEAFAQVHRALRQRTGERVVEAILPLLDRTVAPAPLRGAASSAGVAGA